MAAKFSYSFIKINFHMRKIASLLSMLMLLSVLAFAQTRTVTGQVRDSRGEGVPFATVTESGTKNAVQADANGNFTIRIADNSRLTISAAGFTSQTIDVTGTSATVSLVRTDDTLTEVVVTSALGIRRQPKELGYATAKVTNKELTQANAVNVQSGLTGKVSGLNVSTVNNGVFENTRLTLRGIRSLTGNNQPLLVLDGSTVPLVYLNRLNPNDILDISILKGATGAAVYGSEGVNGVILVTTRQGSRTGAPEVRISNSTQYSTVLFMPKFQTQFGSGSSVDANGIGVYDPIENQQYGDEFDGSVRELGKTAAGGIQQYETYSYKKNGRKSFFETGTTVQNDVSYSAKNFTLSAQDANVKGVLGGDKNRRSTFRFNAGHQYGRLNTNFNIAYTRRSYNVATNSPYWEVFNTAGQVQLDKYKDWRNDPFASPNAYFNEYYQNPYFIKDRSRSTGNNDDIFAQGQFQLKIAPWLNATYRGSTTLENSEYSNTADAFQFSSYAKDSIHKYNASNDYFASVADGTTRSNRITSDVYLNAKKDFNSFGIDAIVGHSFVQDKSKSVAVSGSNLIIPTLFNVSNRTGDPGVGESNGLVRRIGVYGQVQFDYNNWAFITFTGRNDWDSRLPLDNNNFFYPGVNASIVLSDAIPAIKNSSMISYLKLRGAVSKSGSVGPLGAYDLDQAYSVAPGFPYGSLPGFQGSTTINNPAIEPEFVNSKDLGFELGLFKNRVFFEFSAYLQNNTNQIISIDVSRATGSAKAQVNAADFDNKGLEFDLRLTPVMDLGPVTFNFKANLSLMDSKVNSVYQGLDEVSAGNSNYAIVGYPAYVFKLTDYNRDSLGRIIVDATTGLPSLDPKLKIFGRTLPSTILGLSPQFSWNGLSLSATADYRGGHVVYHGIGPDMDFTGSSARSGTNGRQRFIVPNSVILNTSTGKYEPNTSVLVQNGGYGFYEATATNRGVNSNYLSSAAAWKLREVALTYEIPSRLLGRTKFIKGASIGLTGRNLKTWLPDSNQWTDPEFNTTTGNAAGVNNNSILPPTRQMGFNVNLTF
jgi:TonB-linked SusC/RagA family outer membrane protein